MMMCDRMVSMNKKSLARLAHLVEQLPCKDQVASAIPASGSKSGRPWTKNGPEKTRAGFQFRTFF